MKCTVVIIGLLSLTSTLAIENKPDEPKDKREAPVGYPSSGHSSHTLQIQPSIGHESGQAISIGAGYSIGGVKPSFSYGAPSSSYQLSQESSPQSGGHAAIQLPPITLQPEHGGAISSSDLSQLMSQLSHGLSSGAISLQSAEPSYQAGSQLFQGSSQFNQGGAQEVSLPQFSYGAPKQQQYYLAQPQSSGPSYASGSKGLGSYSSTGPVLFAPSSDSQPNQGLTLNYGAPSSGHSFGNSNSFAALSLDNSDGHSLGGSGGYALGGSSAHSLGGGNGHSLGGHGGYSLGSLSGHGLGGSGGYALGDSSGHSSGGASHSLGGHGGYALGGLNGHSLGSPSGHSFGGQSLGGSGHSFGVPIKSLSGSYGAPSKSSFKPSAFLGSSVSDSAHALSGLSASYGSPSFGNSFSGHGGLSLSSLSSSGHGSSFGGSHSGFGSGSSKFGAPSYLPPKPASFSTSLDSNAALSSAGHGHSSSPLGTTYGVPSGSYLPASSAHGSSSPQYYIPSSKHPSLSSFGEGSSSHRAPSHSSHGSLSSFSSSPKHSFGSSSHSAPSSRYGQPKDIQGAYSENSYNTIKYSEELKPRAH